MNCYVCTEKITDRNKTEEHILLNSIGGRLKSNYIICKQCNSEFGEDIDSDLSNQLNFIANMLNIKRERGEPSMKKPIIKLDEEGKKLTVVAPRMKGLKKQLEGLKRKYPTINMDELGKSEVKREYLSERYHFDQVFGGEKAFRSICKTAVNFYMHHGGKKETISYLIDYIKNGSESDSKVAAFYYPEQQQEVIPKNDGEVLHSVILKGNSDNRILYCYVELFNFYRVLVVLNDDYHGVDVEEQYIFDVIKTTTENIRQVNLSVDRDVLFSVITNGDVQLSRQQ